MVLDLTPATANHVLDELRSHPYKPLRVHTNGAFEGVARHTQNRVALLAALWHDAGKLNRNFQLKLDGKKAQGYDHHAYLSALLFLAYCYEHPKIADIGLNGATDVLPLLALIAHHHGHLPHLRRIFDSGERDALFAWMKSQPALPAPDFMAQYGFAAPFDVHNPAVLKKWKTLSANAGQYLDKIENPLDVWLDTQFSFAALVEADKRDAGDNKQFRRQKLLEWARHNFSPPLDEMFDGLKIEKPLDGIRTQIRNEAIQSLRDQLKTNARVFSLTAPTGAGKTFALLALAQEIRAHKGDLSVIYGLPFLSITEQVEAICRDIWKENPDFVSRFDSRAHDERLDDLIKRAEDDPEAALELSQGNFSSRTFDAAFSITTFVQIFETLLSNRNATLLKLPNFAKTIFLLDEIQALPPRLYLFFSAYLQRFCEKFDCYAILSTATMPHLELVAQSGVSAKRDPQTLCPRYKTPPELLNYPRWFSQDVFQRYQIQSTGDWKLEQLADAVTKEEQSTLVILNTIQDTRDLYNQLKDRCDLKGAEIILLNTHFVLDDRRAKIARCKEILDGDKRVILISTQLIEAGVDVDFPVVMRDLCPLPNLIQSAGRCNRNNKLPMGKVVFFTLLGDKGKPRANLIYRLASDQNLLDQTRAALTNNVGEEQLLEVQREFFRRMAHNFEIGRHPLGLGDDRDENTSLIEQIRDFNFPLVGTLRLIDEQQFGHQFQIYVQRDEEDDNWEQLEQRYAELIEAWRKHALRNEKERLQIALEGQLKRMSGRIVTVRSRKKVPSLLPQGEETLCGLKLLTNWENDYNTETGIQFEGESDAIL